MTNRSVGQTAAMLTAVSLSACAWVQPAWLDPGSPCGSKATRALSEVEWDEAMVVPIVISSGEFQPMVIDLRRNRPYRFIIENRDDETRILYAPAFLHTSAIGAISVDGEADDDRCPSQLLVPPLATAEIRLQPLRRGRFQLADTLVPIDVWGAGIGSIRVE